MSATPGAETTGARLRAAAARVESEAGRATPGTWEVTGLLASRPEVVARRGDGGTEHVAEARASSARWIALLSPATAPALVAWLRAAAERADHGIEGDAVVDAALDLARVLRVP